MESSTDSIGFSTSIRPLFRQRDRDAMLSAFDLWKYDDVVQHQDAIFAQLQAGAMPCDGGWPVADVQLLRQWIDGGSQP